MTLSYFLKRLLQFFVVAFIAATINFFFPRMSGQDPVRQKLFQLATENVTVTAEDAKALMETYNAKFGLDRPLWQQYLSYLGNMARLDFGVSISEYPSTVLSSLRRTVPWTVGLLLMATLISFGIGTFVGALLAWDKAPWFLRTIFPAFFTFSAVPFYLMGIVLLYLFAFQIPIFPLFGGFSTQRIPNLSFDFALNILYHSILPALSIVLAQVGFWAMGMRSMMVTIQGEDYMLQAEAKGLTDRRIFYRYAMRNAILPQFTGLALSLGTIISGAILVEVVFSYPGVGSLLLKAVRGFDWFVIQGIVFLVILSVAFTMLVIDLAYPLLDPRINYRSE
ncbi:MAG: ABC transporter permease [Caldilineaceae bacterium]|nr:ABC transporter permease [Caldilineaceae bacterium]